MTSSLRASCSVTGESPACSAIKHVYKPNAVISGVSNKIHNNEETVTHESNG